MSKKKRNRKKKGKVQLSRGALKSSLIRKMKSKPKGKFHALQLKKGLRLKNSKAQIEHCLSQLVQQRIARKVDGNKYMINRKGTAQKNKKAEGYVDMIRSGAAFILVDDMDRDIYISKHKLNGALNGDKVKVVYSQDRDRRPTGKVIDVLQRATNTFQGIYRRRSNKIEVVVDHQAAEFSVEIKNANKWPDIRPGEHVIIRVEEWSTMKTDYHAGIILNTMKGLSQDDVQMSGILMGEGFDLHFQKATLKESELIPDTLVVTEEELAARKDFRQIPTFTIDPTDARDFDDALSVQVLENGEFIVGIHIADVTHYVKQGSALDEEALDRSTSVYLVDRVLPMLPEKLSNNLCSLRPNEDRYSFSAWFKMGQNFEILHKSFGKAIIHSDHRFSYAEAQKVIETGEGPMAKEIQLLNEIAKKYRKARFKNGALNFETDEIRFNLDDDGQPVSVYVKERQEAHLLVEEFMLLANREVATYIAGRTTPPVPFVYRVHDLPDEDKLNDVKMFAQEMGLHLQFDNPKQISTSFEKLRKAASKDPKFKILEPMGIRAMAKAEYSTDNIGHYGLAFDYYTHFTSPIRRYSDVLVHRILQRNLDGTHRVNQKKLQTWCEHISRQERKAQKAERESTKYFQTKYMKKHEGDLLQGTINGIIEMGFFVSMTDSKAEGMVSFESMDEPYMLDSSKLRAKAKYSDTSLKIGDEVMVRVLEVNMERRRIELGFAGFPEEEGQEK